MRVTVDPIGPLDGLKLKICKRYTPETPTSKGFVGGPFGVGVSGSFSFRVYYVVAGMLGNG